MRVLLFFCLLILAVVPVRATRLPARSAYVVDGRLAVLRPAPSLLASPQRRLRVGRAVYPVERRRDTEGRFWLRVALTRRTRGWMLADALALPGDRRDEGRVSALLEELEGLGRLELARVARERFPRLRERAGEAVQEEAERAAGDLAERANRRLGDLRGLGAREVRALMLSDPALDRYGRLGVVFDADPRTRRYIVLKPGPKRP